MPFVSDDDLGVLQHWLCPGCRNPQSDALAICLECGRVRPAPEPGRTQRWRVGYTVVVALVLLASLVMAGGAA